MQQCIKKKLNKTTPKKKTKTNQPIHIKQNKKKKKKTNNKKTTNKGFY